jgi:menaquinone-dependent protoporphyrinogen oxidase
VSVAFFEWGRIHYAQSIRRAADAQGRDVLVTVELKEIGEFKVAINPRNHQVFFGGLDASKLTFGHRMVRKMPAARTLFPEGDFRNWNDIGAWAISIALAL